MFHVFTRLQFFAFFLYTVVSKGFRRAMSHRAADTLRHLQTFNINRPDSYWIRFSFGILRGT